MSDRFKLVIELNIFSTAGKTSVSAIVCDFLNFTVERDTLFDAIRPLS